MNTHSAQPELDLTTAHRVATIIVGGMLGGLVMLAVMSEIITRATANAGSGELGMLRTVFYGVSFSTIVLVRYVSGSLRAARAGENVQQVLLRLLRAATVTAALCEIPGILGFALIVLGGQRTDMFILMAMSVGMGWAFFPRMSVWRKEVDSARRYSGQLDPVR